MLRTEYLGIFQNAVFIISFPVLETLCCPVTKFSDRPRERSLFQVILLFSMTLGMTAFKLLKYQTRNCQSLAVGAF